MIEMAMVVVNLAKWTRLSCGCDDIKHCWYLCPETERPGNANYWNTLFCAQKESDRKRERHHSVSKLLSGVDDMRIQDALDAEYGNAWSNEDDVSNRTQLLQQ